MKEKVGGGWEEPSVLAGGCAPPHLQGLQLIRHEKSLRPAWASQWGTEAKKAWWNQLLLSQWNNTITLAKVVIAEQVEVMECVCEYCITPDSCLCIHMCTRQINQQRHVSGRLIMWRSQTWKKRWCPPGGLNPQPLPTQGLRTPAWSPRWLLAWTVQCQRW